MKNERELLRMAVELQKKAYEKTASTLKENVIGAYVKEAEGNKTASEMYAQSKSLFLHTTVD